jgi:predicted RNA-binding protein with PIN domain
MDLVIDGYNLIGSEQGLSGALEPKRKWLIQQLSTYHTIKNFAVVVVFDGWRSGWVNEVTEKNTGIAVVYSRQGEKADSVIVRIAREKGSGCVVVTSDREVRNAVERFGAVAIYAEEFNRILRNIDRSCGADADGESDLANSKKGNPHRLSKAERKRQEKLRKLRP